ncbi:ABC transporter ATP-binding protein [Brockia lithotrophica]|uniref:Iron(III) transport system ATP-binding protein n=1 Tax=Brockia lithotrophica TaxID=933949 RepID=A0A660L883_9BACL|nr:ABC transporter ATP-binding protein [Brockia lithotrophica]RKQ89079.1 iron(III) transport system ATP-binding protein [Brockia lithotrophica]
MKVELSGVSVKLGNRTVLREVSLSVPSGAFLAVLGPSGSGKTTLLHAIAGFVPLESGTISFDGQIVSRAGYRLPPEEREVGVVFQSFALWPHMTVEEHITFPLLQRRRRRFRTELEGKGIFRRTIGKYLSNKTQSKPKEDAAVETIEHEVEKLLKLTELLPFRKRFPSELSGGQKQRVAFARALAASRKLLLLDEPFSHLDAPLRATMQLELAKLHRTTGSTVIFVTHDREEALALADLIAVVKDGRVVQIGPPDEVYLQPNSPFVAAFVAGAALVPGTWRGKWFTPLGYVGDEVWDGTSIPPAFREAGCFPVRPEEWVLRKYPPGIPVRIVRRAYEGRTVRLTVELAATEINPDEVQCNERETADWPFRKTSFDLFVSPQKYRDICTDPGQIRHIILRKSGTNIGSRTKNDNNV